MKTERYLPIIFFFLFITGCKQEINSPETPETDRSKDFDSLWSTYDKYYPLFSYKKIGWQDIYNSNIEKFRQPLSRTERDNYFSEILSIFKDEHIKMWMQNGTIKYPFTKEVVYNANPAYFSNHFAPADWHQVNYHWGWGKKNNIGYLVFTDFHENSIDSAAFADAMDSLRQTEGIIIDLRNNLGGNLLLCESLWNRFTSKEITVGYILYRNGAGHDDFAPKEYEVVKPEGAWQYTKKVAVLTGQVCGSAGEIFAETFSHFDNALLIGATTRGSVTAPADYKLQDGITYSVPIVAYYSTSGIPLEWNGVEPDVKLDYNDQSNPTGDLICEYAVKYIKGTVTAVKKQKTFISLAVKYDGEIKSHRQTRYIPRNFIIK